MLDAQFFEPRVSSAPKFRLNALNVRSTENSTFRFDQTMRYVVYACITIEYRRTYYEIWTEKYLFSTSLVFYLTFQVK